MAVKKLIDGSGVKAVVSHQHRYGVHYQKVKEIASSGGLGRIQSAYGTSPGWYLHIATHLVDYMRWYLGNPDAEWVMGQAAGKGKLSDNHPSPDYIGGFIQFANGVLQSYKRWDKDNPHMISSSGRRTGFSCPCDGR